MKIILLAVSTLILSTVSSLALAQTCQDLPKGEEVKKALIEARKNTNGGLNLDMWGTVVDRSGTVCSVVYTGETVDAQWPGSRVISAQKANTANAFSLAGSALSTANLYSATQPGGFLFGLAESNPVNPAVAYQGAVATFGSAKDPMIGQRVGGVNVFGGGLALYNSKGQILGGLGVSGDTSCADHNIAWRTRNALKLDFVPKGVSSEKDKVDNIVYDIGMTGKSRGGFGHPKCGGKEHDLARKLPPVSTVAK
ncbi:MAG: heme-binding protein [Bdellovibrionales bacterium]|nr:heme-binding protein [Bdellovibrionales bacterium]